MMLLFLKNDVLFFFIVLVLSLSAMLILPSDFIIVDFCFLSNRRVTTGHTFSATTVKFILFSVVKKLENFCTKRPQNGFQMTLGGRIRAKLNHKKLQFWDLCMCVHL